MKIFLKLQIALFVVAGLLGSGFVQAQEQTKKTPKMYSEGGSGAGVSGKSSIDRLNEEIEKDAAKGNSFSRGEEALIKAPSYSTSTFIYVDEEAIQESINSTDADRREAFQRELVRTGRIIEAMSNYKVRVIENSKEISFNGRVWMFAKVKLLESYDKGKIGWIHTTRLKRVTD